MQIDSALFLYLFFVLKSALQKKDRICTFRHSSAFSCRLSRANNVQGLHFVVMITTRFYLDCRAVGHGQPAPLRLVITKKSVRAYLPLSVSLLPTHWDARRQMVVGHPRKVALNNFIQSQKLAVVQIIFRLADAGELSGLSASKIKDKVLTELQPSDDSCSEQTPHACFKAFIEMKAGRTREIYKITLSRILAYCPHFATLVWEDVNVKWLEGFDKFLAKTSPSRNARNIHFRNIRAVFNRAIDDEVTQCYPFRKFKIKNIPTRKRSLTVEQLRTLFSLQLNAKDQRYLDAFKLSFLLIGINAVDLCRAAPAVNGRVEYERAKTHKLYSIKVEPETEALIAKYAGASRLVSFAENCKSYLSFYKHMADSLRDLGATIGVEGFSSYWARHTWATLAADLDIPDATISLALGHAGENKTTEIYIRRNQKKVDAANRRVLDFVFCDDHDH